MAHPARLLLLTLVLSLVANQWSPVAAFEDFLDDIFSIFFDSESESESSEPIHVAGKHAVINVTCDNCTLTINCPTCSSMSMAGGMIETAPTAPTAPAAPAAPAAPPSPNGDAATVAPTTNTTMKTVTSIPAPAEETNNNGGAPPPDPELPSGDAVTMPTAASNDSSSPPALL